MFPVRRSTRIRAALVAAPAALTAVLLFGSGTAYADVALTRISSDPYTDAQAQHDSEVEPDTFSSGSTIVSAFQVGRVFGAARPTSVGPPPPPAARPGPAVSCPR